MDNSNKHSIFSIIIAVAAVCVIFGVMQGVHDNYGIMLNSLSDTSQTTLYMDCTAGTTYYILSKSRSATISSIMFAPKQ